VCRATCNGSNILATYRAHVERETLERVANCIAKTYAHTGEGLPVLLQAAIEREFALKGESDAKRD